MGQHGSALTLKVQLFGLQGRYTTSYLLDVNVNGINASAGLQILNMGVCNVQGGFAIS